MAKQKTKKGVVRRMKLTKSGMVKRRHAFTSHLLVRRDRKRKRNLRRAAIVPGALGIQMAKCLGRFKIATHLRKRSPAPASSTNS
jgi:large subunit ribosomal protein L35